MSEHEGELVHHDQVSPATVRVLGHGRRDRARRALLALAGCWGAAIGAVFLPLLHFILVPALVLAGPLMAWSRMRQRLTILDVEGSCPACGVPLREPLGGDVDSRLELRCEACRRALTVRLSAELLER